MRRTVMRPRSEPKIVGSVPWRPSDRLDVGKTRDSLGIGDRLHPAANDDAPTGLLLLIHAVDLGGGARWTVRGWDRVLASHDIKRGAGSPDVLTRGRRTASPDPQPLLNHPNRLRVPLTPRSPRPRTGVPRDQSVARSSSMCRSAQTCRPVSGWTTAPPRSRRSERPRPRQVPTESSRRERTQPGSRTPTARSSLSTPGHPSAPATPPTASAAADQQVTDFGGAYPSDNQVHLHSQTAPTSASTWSSTCSKPSDIRTPVDGFGPGRVCAMT